MTVAAPRVGKALLFGTKDCGFETYGGRHSATRRAYACVWGMLADPSSPVAAASLLSEPSPL